MISSSSYLSIESLLKNLRPTSNTASIPSASSSIYAGKQREDDHEQFAQAVQAIVTSDESQSQASPSSSRIHIEDDQRSHGNTSDDINHEKIFFDKYESHSSEDRDQSLENLISRLLAAQQQSSNRQFQSLDNILPEVVSSHAQQENPPLIIDDLVADVLSSISSLSVHTPVDPRSASPEIALLIIHKN